MNSGYIFIWIIYILYTLLQLTKSDDWIPWGESEYFFHKSLSWANARYKCIDLDSTLTSVTSMQENEFLTRHLHGRSHWIGLTPGDTSCSCYRATTAVCQACRQSWLWLDGSPMNFTNWFSGQPYQLRDCGRMHLSGVWYSTLYCNDARPFICKRPLCDNLHCLHGECVAFQGRASCECDSGYTGNLCETEIDECLSSPCFNNGTCVDEINSYKCLCNDYYNGTHCEIDTFVPEEEDADTDKQLSFVDGLNEKALKVSFVIGVIVSVISFIAMLITIYLYHKAVSKLDNEEKNIKENVLLT